jgi:hypothetical protein
MARKLGKATGKGKPEIYSLSEQPPDDALIGLRSLRPRKPLRPPKPRRRGLLRRLRGR